MESTSSTIQNLLNKRKVEDNNHDESGNTSSNSNTEDDPEPKRPRTQEEKKLDRILANRRSARRSRERRKQLQENLEKSIILLTRQNEDLTRENDMLKQELRVLLNVFNGKRNIGSVPSAAAPVNFPDDNIRNEILLRMSGNNAASSGGLMPDRNSYVASLAANNTMHQQPNRPIPDIFLQGAGQQMFAHATPGLFNGQGNAGMRRWTSLYFFDGWGC